MKPNQPQCRSRFFITLFGYFLCQNLYCKIVSDDSFWACFNIRFSLSSVTCYWDFSTSNWIGPSHSYLDTVYLCVPTPNVFVITTTTLLCRLTFGHFDFYFSISTLHWTFFSMDFSYCFKTIKVSHFQNSDCVNNHEFLG